MYFFWKHLPYESLSQRVEFLLKFLTFFILEKNFVRNFLNFQRRKGQIRLEYKNEMIPPHKLCGITSQFKGTPSRRMRALQLQLSDTGELNASDLPRKKGKTPHQFI